MSWSGPVNVSVSGQDAYDPHAVVALDGTVTAVWYQFDSGEFIVQSNSSIDGGVSWSGSVDVSAPGQNAIDPQVSVASDGTVTAVWIRFDGSNWIVQSSSSVDGGVSWSGPINVSAPGQDADNVRVVVATDGTNTAVWRRFDGSNWIVQSSSSVDGGASWSVPVDMSVLGQDAFAPQVALASDGAVTAIWFRLVGSDFIVQSSNTEDKGVSWSAPVAVSLPGQSAYDPQAVVASDGTVTAVWQRFDGSDFTIQSSFSLSAPTITSVSLPNPQQGTAYSFQLTADGAPVPTFSMGSGTLPPGLTLSATGLISGTPTSAGNFAFTITASNGEAPDATASYTLKVAAFLAATGSEALVSGTLIAAFLLALGSGLFARSRVRLRRQ